MKKKKMAASRFGEDRWRGQQTKIDESVSKFGMRCAPFNR